MSVLVNSPTIQSVPSAACASTLFLSKQQLYEQTPHIHQVLPVCGERTIQSLQAKAQIKPVI